MKPFTFSRIPHIMFGAGMLDKLPALVTSRGKNVLLLTGRASFRHTELYAKLITDLQKNGITVFETTVVTEPSPALIDTLTSEYRSKNINVVVAIGGGSVLDAGKALSAMLPMNDSVMDYLEGVGTKVHPGTKVPFIAVPTTSGTGSEATKNAVLSEIGEKGYKKSLRHDNFMPDVALVDPRLTLTCPADVTAACGMDAYTQLLEAYTSDGANELTDGLALSGLKRISHSLMNVCKHPGDLDARTDLSYASLMSGICLAQAGLGIVHGFASPIGGYFDIPHGVVCGTLLGACTRINIDRLRNDPSLKKYPAKYADAGRLLTDINGKDDIYYTSLLSDTLDKWVEELKLPRLSHYGITATDFDRIIAGTGNKNNPVKLTKEDMRTILGMRL